MEASWTEDKSLFKRNKPEHTSPVMEDASFIYSMSVFSTCLILHYARCQILRVEQSEILSYSFFWFKGNMINKKATLKINKDYF